MLNQLCVRDIRLSHGSCSVLRPELPIVLIFPLLWVRDRVLSLRENGSCTLDCISFRPLNISWNPIHAQILIDTEACRPPGNVTIT